MAVSESLHQITRLDSTESLNFQPLLLQHESWLKNDEGTVRAAGFTSCAEAHSCQSPYETLAGTYQLPKIYVATPDTP